MLRPRLCIGAPASRYGVASSFGRHCSALRGNAPERSPRGPRGAGSGRVGMQRPRLCIGAPTSCYGVASSLEDIALPCAVVLKRVAHLGLISATLVVPSPIHGRGAGERDGL